MNAKQLQYVIQLSKVLNFSQVAEQLNISQPALSKQVLSLENELGVKLFDRNTSPMTLTPAGEFFVREAQDLLYREDQLLRTMERYKSGESGRLVIGISPFRSLYLVPRIVKRVQQKYPDIQVFLQETGSDRLRKEMAEGKYDFAIVNLPVDESVLDVTCLEPDTLVLVVPNHMLDRLPERPDGNLPEIEMRQCRDLPFIVVGQTQEMRQLFDKLCARAGFHPRIAMEVVGLSTAWAMSHAGIGATLLPLQFVSEELFTRDVTLFRLKNDIFTRQPVIITRRGQYLSEFAKYAIALLTQPKKYK